MVRSRIFLIQGYFPEISRYRRHLEDHAHDITSQRADRPDDRHLHAALERLANGDARFVHAHAEQGHSGGDDRDPDAQVQEEEREEGNVSNATKASTASGKKCFPDCS